MSEPHGGSLVLFVQQLSIICMFSARLAKITASIIGSSSDGDDGCITVRELEDQLMGVRIKETDNLAELKEVRQKVLHRLDLFQLQSCLVPSTCPSCFLSPLLSGR